MADILAPWEKDKIYVLSSSTETQIGASVTAAVMARFLLPCAANILQAQYACTNAGASIVDIDFLADGTSILDDNTDASYDLGDGAQAGFLVNDSPSTIYAAGTNVTVIQTTDSGDTIDDIAVNLFFVPV